MSEDRHLCLFFLKASKTINYIQIIFTWIWSGIRLRFILSNRMIIASFCNWKENVELRIVWGWVALFLARSMKRISSPSHWTEAENEQLCFVSAICSKLINACRIELLSLFSGSSPKFNCSFKKHNCLSCVIWPGVTMRVERNGPSHYIIILQNISRWPLLTLCQSDWSRWPWALFKALL